MLTSISPLGEQARHNRWAVTASAYLAGSVAAAAATGALLGAAGALLGAPLALRAALVALGAVVALLIDSGILPLPTIHRQVNEDWLNRYRGWVYGVGFGVQLGVGAATIVTTATIYLVLAGELLVGSAGAGALVGVTFGLVRAAPLLAAGRARSYGQLVTQHRQLVALAPTGQRITLAVTALAATVAVAITIGSLT